jgi:hypothetical protein
MMNGILLSVVMLNFFMLSVIMLTVVAQKLDWSNLFLGKKIFFPPIEIMKCCIKWCHNIDSR